MRNIHNVKNVPIDGPKKSSGKFTCKIVAKNDYIRADGTCALYVQIFIEGKRKRLPLNIYIKPKMFDSKKQQVRGNSQIAKDYNLIIGKKLSDINKIAISYRLSDSYLTLDKLVEDLTNPTSKTDFIKFYEDELKKQKNIIEDSTHAQQESTLRKIKKFKSRIFFQDITEDLIKEFKSYCKKTLKNQDNTISTALKNLKKYLHIANKKGIKTPLNYSEIVVKRFKSNRVFLDEQELKTLFEYRESKFVPDDYKNVLDRFLFSCFTGLRISDIQRLTTENIVGDYLAFKIQKTKKFHKIKLNNTSKIFINDETLFKGKYYDQDINEILKEIAKNAGVQKHLTFHVARHTFATNFLIKGGRVENLQKILGHSMITETMIYVHIVDNLLNDEISNLDNILLK
ncbi:site-specific integrase [uncultured Tenacibaculum sp.]|uniref:site-specific integrase n=1 Tax=uncultured Tenacibaculum sp. TaxID=174713 RepID=UPI00261BA4D6|nr:site-specific integrase [uncultured Tenacibaculum sp.]